MLKKHESLLFAVLISGFFVIFRAQFRDIENFAQNFLCEIFTVFLFEAFFEIVNFEWVSSDVFF